MEIVEMWLVVFSFVGAVAGGVLGGWLTLRSAKAERRRAREDWVRDQRMEVYTRFRKDFEHRLDVLSDPDAAFGPPPPDDYIVPVFNLVDEVRFVGPPNVGDEAKVAAERLQDYMNSPSAESHARYQATAVAQDGVASSMRHALGFSTFGELSG